MRNTRPYTLDGALFPSLDMPPGMLAHSGVLRKFFTDGPSILRTSIILGLSSTFRTASTGSMGSTEGLNTASTGSMSSTEGLDTASAGSMRSKGTASTGVSAVSDPEILGVKSIRSTEPRNTVGARSIYSRNTAGTLTYSSCSPRK